MANKRTVLECRRCKAMVSALCALFKLAMLAMCIIVSFEMGYAQGKGDAEQSCRTDDIPYCIPTGEAIMNLPSGKLTADIGGTNTLTSREDTDCGHAKE